MSDRKEKGEGLSLQSRRELEQQIAQRANKDAAFRQLLFKNPKRALKEAFDVELPAKMELHVLEETTSKLYIVLPVLSAELSETNLEKVAGGGTVPRIMR